jgi:hypothetical protein
MEEMKIIAEQERNERLAERQRKIDAGELIEDEDEDEAAKKGFIKNLEFFFLMIILYVQKWNKLYLMIEIMNPKKKILLIKFPKQYQKVISSFNHKKRISRIYFFRG